MGPTLESKNRRALSHNHLLLLKVFELRMSSVWRKAHLVTMTALQIGHGIENPFKRLPL